MIDEALSLITHPTVMWLTRIKQLFWINIDNMSLNEQMLLENKQTLVCGLYYIYIINKPVLVINIFLQNVFIHSSFNTNIKNCEKKHQNKIRKKSKWCVEI